MTNKTNPSETTTEAIFREFYGVNTFIEKSAIPAKYGFQSKKGGQHKGYPDFFRANTSDDDFVIIVEAKADDLDAARREVELYATNNKIKRDIVAIAISGQSAEEYEADLFIHLKGGSYHRVENDGKLLSLDDIRSIYKKEKVGNFISDKALRTVLIEINNTFHYQMEVKPTRRSLLFAGLMIALKDPTFRSTYNAIQPPTTAGLYDAHNLNQAIINAITAQISSKVNNYSKEYNWRNQFVFIESIDYSLTEYKKLIAKIDTSIFTPFEFDEKQDILGHAYKIFLSRAGKQENKNIILTPDHIKSLMVRLADLQVDDVVIDTCTGSGGFLMEAMEIMVGKAKNRKKTIDRIKEQQLIGFESDDTLFALACSNMFLHGDGRTNLIYGDSL